MPEAIMTLDVREDLRQGREPFSRIMAAVAQLRGDALRLIAPFEPVPLYRVLDGLGFDHSTHQAGPGEWHVLFQRRGAATSSPPAVAESGDADGGGCGCSCGCSRPDVLEVDARGLEPPEPMV